LVVGLAVVVALAVVVVVAFAVVFLFVILSAANEPAVSRSWAAPNRFAILFPTHLQAPQPGRARLQPGHTSAASKTLSALPKAGAQAQPKRPPPTDPHPSQNLVKPPNPPKSPETPVPIGDKSLERLAYSPPPT
jgi:hypothetical protein